jgi:hypothetical protein
LSISWLPSSYPVSQTALIGTDQRRYLSPVGQEFLPLNIRLGQIQKTFLTRTVCFSSRGQLHAAVNQTTQLTSPNSCLEFSTVRKLMASFAVRARFRFGSTQQSRQSYYTQKKGNLSSEALRSTANSNKFISFCLFPVNVWNINHMTPFRFDFLSTAQVWSLRFTSRRNWRYHFLGFLLGTPTCSRNNSS